MKMTRASKTPMNPEKLDSLVDYIHREWRQRLHIVKNGNVSATANWLESPHTDSNEVGVMGLADLMAHQMEVSGFLVREEIRAGNDDEAITHFVSEREAAAICDAAAMEM
jgi:hypothetical protein